MVSFCEKCGFLLIPKQKNRINKGFIALYCNFCKKTEKKGFDEISYKISTRIPHGENDQSLIIDEEFNADPIIRNTCPKCGYQEAHYWEAGDRRKQEWEPITYYRCIKCKMTWND